MENGLTIQTPTPANLLELALQKGVDTDQLEKLMDLQDRWEKKEAKKEFLNALSHFQTIVPVIKKAKTANIASRTGSSFSYKYADLGSITQSIKKSLNECGLSYRWEFEEQGGKLKCTCHVSHRGGHTETATMEAGKDTSGAKNDIQQTGSTQTYLQRYTLIGALGLSTAEEDNDAKTSETSLTDDEILQQWSDAINHVRTRVELNKLYAKNQKAIDANPKLQGFMKAKQDELKASPSVNPAASMP